jgi:divalent metal cation (Fe/Co/Zn/Cd) transporter
MVNNVYEDFKHLLDEELNDEDEEQNKTLIDDEEDVE